MHSCLEVGLTGLSQKNPLPAIIYLYLIPLSFNLLLNYFLILNIYFMYDLIFDSQFNTYLFLHNWYNFSLFNYWNKIVFIIIIDFVREVFVWLWFSVKPYMNFLNIVRDIWTLTNFSLKIVLCNYRTTSLNRFWALQF